MHPNEIAINEYVDGSMDPGERAGVEQHLASCASCRQVVQDLRDIARATATLELREPPVRAWARLERAITLERENSGARGVQPSETGAHANARLPFDWLRAPRARRGVKGSRPVGSRSVAWLAVAAALVLATVVGLRFVPASGRRETSPAAATGATASVAAGEAAQSVEAELRQAEAHYEKAIKGLEQIANTEQSELDPRTAATLRKNLGVIDQAINESRAAVRSQPGSEPAQQSLIEGFKTKIGLLQDTVALINEMRKGNEAGAARIVSGLKQKGD
jgi:anti-sigma factor RsiW